jgi:hypothetical protein
MRAAQRGGSDCTTLAHTRVATSGRAASSFAYTRDKPCRFGHWRFRRIPSGRSCWYCHGKAIFAIGVSAEPAERRLYNSPPSCRSATAVGTAIAVIQQALRIHAKLQKIRACNGKHMRTAKTILALQYVLSLARIVQPTMLALLFDFTLSLTEFPKKMRRTLLQSRR